MDFSEKLFIDILGRVQKKCHNTSIVHGWWDMDNPFSQQLANMHGELSEAWEWYRKRNPSSDHIPEFSGIEEEFADTIIRILDSCEANGYRLAEAMLAKMKYNETREYRHGGKKA